MDEIVERQRAICREHSAEFVPPRPGSHVGAALQTLDRLPLHGLRMLEEGSACGWFLWAGDERSDGVDFYQPLCVEHLPDRCPLALDFLALPPGWRFLTDGRYIDVWYDPQLLDSQ